MDTTQDTKPPSGPGRAQLDGNVPALVLVYCPDEPWRTGQVALFTGPGVEMYLGRGEALDGERRVVLLEQRPTCNVDRPPLSDRSLSRLQVRVARTPRSLLESMLRVELLPSKQVREMRINGEPCRKGSAIVGRGETVQIRGSTCKLLFYATSRPRQLSFGSFAAAELPPFGWADEHGMAGETPPMWRLRELLAFAAAAGDHVLLHGPSGSGTELAARALHRMSKRADMPFVARSAASFLEGVTDADLFGSVGDAARRGLFGEVEGGTLFLDDIGKLSPRDQARLLRVLQKPGEYTPVGASAPRRSDVWVIGAISGSPTELEPEFASRFLFHIEVPGLNERREDIVLIAQELVLRFLLGKRELEERFIFESKHRGPPGWVPYEFVRFDPALIDMLLRWTYTAHVRELEALLIRAIAASQGNAIEPYPGLKEALDKQIQRRLRLNEPETEQWIEGPALEEGAVDEEELLRGLSDGPRGAKAKAARALGISRQKLDRRLAKYRTKGGGGDGGGGEGKKGPS